MIAVVSVRGMSLVRRATAEDAEEVLRLRQVMINTLTGRRRQALLWECHAMPSIVCGTIVADRAVPRAP